MLFAITGHFKPGMEAKREEVHQQFNEHLEQRIIRVRLGGPLFNEAGTRSGVLLIVEAKDVEGAQAYLAASPYFSAGLYERVEINELRLEVGALR